MAKKPKKRRQKMPKLSFVDKLIYWFVFLILCAFWILIGALPAFSFDSIAFADESVVASHQNGTVLWVLVPWMTFFLMTLILWLIPYQERRPLFGIRGFQYGPPNTPKIYPLLRKDNPPVWISEKKKRDRKRIALVLSAVLLFSFIPYPWAFFGRACLHFDGSITQYNIFNTQIAEFTSGQIASVELKTYRYDTGGRYSTNWNWSVEAVFQTDNGKEYCFKATDFDNASQDEIQFWLTAMNQLKRRYDPAGISYSGAEDLGKVIEDRNLNEVEIQMLYQLFELLEP